MRHSTRDSCWSFLSSTIRNDSGVLTRLLFADQEARKASKAQPSPLPLLHEKLGHLICRKCHKCGEFLQTIQIGLDAPILDHTHVLDALSGVCELTVRFEILRRNRFNSLFFRVSFGCLFGSLKQWIPAQVGQADVRERRAPGAPRDEACQGEKSVLVY